MKKRILIFIVSFILIIGLLLFLYNILSIDKESLIIEYLENKYNQKFIIYSKIESIENRDFLYAYNVYPENNKDIVFVAGKQFGQNIFPFLPPIKDQIFFDNYFEKSKIFITDEVLVQNEFILDDSNDIEKLANTIYSTMAEINKVLSEFGFSTTKYTCSITVPIYIKQNVEEVYFYMLDETAIYNIIYNLYYEDELSN